jgi:DNA-binding XRE family transcriptional regulator
LAWLVLAHRISMLSSDKARPNGSCRLRRRHLPSIPERSNACRNRTQPACHGAANSSSGSRNKQTCSRMGQSEAARQKFNPPRLTWARRRRGITKIVLAAAVGTDVRSIKAYEAGEFAPRPESVHQIAQALRFPDGFFFGDVHFSRAFASTYQ